MKKQMISLAALAGLALGVTVAYAGSTAGTGIVGSKHDMSTISGIKADKEGRVCAFCHTPHHKLTDATADYNPLWSHEFTKDVTYLAYQSVTFDGYAKISGTDVLTGPSRLCMSCHDGNIAIDQHYGLAGNNPDTTRIKGDFFGEIAVGKGHDLTNDHPIGFDITGYGTGNGVDTSNGLGMSVFGNAIKATLAAPGNPKLDGKPFESVGFKAADGTNWFTCASCHEVHNKDNKEDFFLYVEQTNSQFCLMCHDK